MNKSLEVKVKFNIFAGEASSKEPIGPTLGQYGVSIDKFCTAFNELTSIFNEKIVVRAKILIYSDKSFNILLKVPSINFTLKNILVFENINLYDIKRKAGYFMEKNEYIPNLNKNIIYTLCYFLLSINLYDKVKVYSLFKKIKGTLHSSGILINTK